jgi:hypothetical protein
MKIQIKKPMREIEYETNSVVIVSEHGRFVILEEFGKLTVTFAENLVISPRGANSVSIKEVNYFDA